MLAIQEKKSDPFRLLLILGKERGYLFSHEVNTALAAEDPRKCQVVEMKFFGGLSTGEISQSLAVSPETVQRDWKLAKLWLLRHMTENDKSGDA